MEEINISEINISKENISKENISKEIDFWFQISEEAEEWVGVRIDKCLSTFMDSFSRSYLQKLLKDEYVKVNGLPVKANYRIKNEDEIQLSVPEAVVPDITPEPIPLDVLYEDDDLLVVNKPKGMVVHPAPGHYSGTLVNALMCHCAGKLSGINGILRPGIVHRIDKDTTGSLLVCKNDFSHNHIAEQLQQHTINRKYLAIVWGRLSEVSGTVSGPIGRHPSERTKMAIVPDGKEAVTHFQVLKQFDKYAYLECRLETGRTHQIRVHMASLGHPLLGDTVYGGGKSPFRLVGQTLHAQTLGFIHPRTREYLEVAAPIPKYFNHLLSVLT